MKSNVARKEVETFNIGAKSGFTIKASPKAFRILSSGLYSDKVKAVIRELSTNAFDAQVSLGKGDQPFRVRLPNHFEPRFEVRDFGPGLSEEDVMHLYTTYFESTKTESNDYVGALGLGSKSPFSYSDSFTVVSYFGGKRTTYMAFIDNDFPNISKVVEDDTDEPTGLEIQVPVRPGDHAEFVSKAVEVYKAFETKPTIVGNKAFDLTDNRVVVFKNDYVKVFASNNHNNRYYHNYGYGNQQNITHFARMGNILYPLTTQTIFVKPMGITANEYQYISDLVGNVTEFELKFDIGEIDIAASREELSYDEATIEAIQKKLLVLYNDMKAEYKDFYIDCNTMYEAAIKRKTFIEKDTRFSKWIIGKILYKGVIPPTEEHLPFDKINVFGCSHPFKSRRKLSHSRYSSTAPEFIHYYGENYKIVINDTKSGVLKRIESHFKDDKARVYTSIHIIEEKGSDAVKYIELIDQIKELGIPILKTSEMDFEKAKSVKIDKDDRLIPYFTVRRDRYNRNIYSAAGRGTIARDLPKNFVYVNGESGSVKDSGIHKAPSDFGASVIDVFNDIFPDEKVHVIYKTQADIIKKYNGMHLKDFIKANIKKSDKYKMFLKTTKVNAYQKVINDHFNISNTYYGSHTYRNFKILSSDNKTHKLLKFINFADKMFDFENKKVTIKFSKDAKTYFGDLDLRSEPSCDRIEKYIKILSKKYPMVFDCVNLGCDISTMKPHIKKYILEQDKR